MKKNKNKGCNFYVMYQNENKFFVHLMISSYSTTGLIQLFIID